MASSSKEPLFEEVPFRNKPRIVPPAGGLPASEYRQSLFLQQLSKATIRKEQTSSAGAKEIEEFRLHLENLCRDALEYVERGDGNTTFRRESVKLEVIGSRKSGYALNESNLDLVLLSPESTIGILAPDHQILELLQQLFWARHVGARLLTRTRVPMLKGCQLPTERLYNAILKEIHSVDRDSQAHALRPVHLRQETEEVPDPELIRRLEIAVKEGWCQEEPEKIIIRNFKRAFSKGKESAELIAARSDLAALQSVLTRYHEPLDPNLKMPRSGVGIQFTMCFSNELVRHSTELLRCYGRCDCRVQDVVIFIKTWAKRRDINDTERGTLSSYGYTIMVLHFLINVVKPPVLPNLQRQLSIRRGGSPYTPGNCEGRNIRFWRDEAAIENAVLHGEWNFNTESIGSLLRGFFEYYYNPKAKFQKKRFTWGREVISIRSCGGIVSRQSKGWASAEITQTPTFFPWEKPIEVRERYLLCIEDPFETDRNIGRAISFPGLCKMKTEFKRAHRIIEHLGRFEGPKTVWDLLEVANHSDLDRPWLYFGSKPSKENSTGSPSSSLQKQWPHGKQGIQNGFAPCKENGQTLPPPPPPSSSSASNFDWPALPHPTNLDISKKRFKKNIQLGTANDDSNAVVAEDKRYEKASTTSESADSFEEENYQSRVTRVDYSTSRRRRPHRHRRCRVTPLSHEIVTKPQTARAASPPVNTNASYGPRAQRNEGEISHVQRDFRGCKENLVAAPANKFGVGIAERHHKQANAEKSQSSMKSADTSEDEDESSSPEEEENLLEGVAAGSAPELGITEVASAPELPPKSEPSQQDSHLEKKVYRRPVSIRLPPAVLATQAGLPSQTCLENSPFDFTLVSASPSVATLNFANLKANQSSIPSLSPDPQLWLAAPKDPNKPDIRTTVQKLVESTRRKKKEAARLAWFSVRSKGKDKKDKDTGTGAVQHENQNAKPKLAPIQTYSEPNSKPPAPLEPPNHPHVETSLPSAPETRSKPTFPTSPLPKATTLHHLPTQQKESLIRTGLVPSVLPPQNKTKTQRPTQAQQRVLPPQGFRPPQPQPQSQSLPYLPLLQLQLQPQPSQPHRQPPRVTLPQATTIPSATEASRQHPVLQNKGAWSRCGYGYRLPHARGPAPALGAGPAPTPAPAFSDPPARTSGSGATPGVPGVSGARGAPETSGTSTGGYGHGHGHGYVYPHVYKGHTEYHYVYAHGHEEGQQDPYVAGYGAYRGYGHQVYGHHGYGHQGYANQSYGNRG